MKPAGDFRRLFERIVAAGPDPAVEAEWRRVSEEVEQEVRANLCAAIDQEWGLGTAAQLGADPYGALLLATPDRDRVLRVLATAPRAWRPETKHDRYELHRLAATFGMEAETLRWQVAADGYMLAVDEIGRPQHIKIGKRFVKDLFGGKRRRVSAREARELLGNGVGVVEEISGSLFAYRGARLALEPRQLVNVDEALFVHWIAQASRSAAQATLRGEAWPRIGGDQLDQGTIVRGVTGDERWMSPQEVFPPPDDLGEREEVRRAQEEAMDLAVEELSRLVHGMASEAEAPLSPQMREILAALMAAIRDCVDASVEELWEVARMRVGLESAAWRMAKKRTLDRLRSNGELVEVIEEALGRVA